MAALTKNSKFYYGITVDESNRYIDLVVSGVPTVAILKIGNYSPEQFAKEIERVISQANTNGSYKITFDRIQKKLTYVIDDVFTDEYYFKFLTGDNSHRSAFSLLGFDQVDTDILVTTTAPNVVCKEYVTQYFPQNYLPTKHNKKARLPMLNTATSGHVELVKFGDDRFLEFEIPFITDIEQVEGSVIRSNPSGVQDYIDLIEWCTEKAYVEIMVDESKPLEYESFILESTEQSNQGLDYELIELYDKGLAFFYRSGLLKFKVVEV